MAVTNPKDEDSIPDLSKRRKRKQQVPERLKKPKTQARPTDVPAVVVRIAGRTDPVTLLNIPQSSKGADLVLWLIGAYPDHSLLTDEFAWIRLGDITRVDCPKRGELEIEEAKKVVPEPPGTFRHLRARVGKHSSDIVSICNLPDTPLGREVFDEILAKYGGCRMHEYILYTTDHGYAPIRALAETDRGLF